MTSLAFGRKVFAIGTSDGHWVGEGSHRECGGPVLEATVPMGTVVICRLSDP